MYKRQQITIAVYNFTDQTGQRKPNPGLIIALYLFACFLLVASYEAKAHHESCMACTDATIVDVVDTDEENSNKEDIVIYLDEVIVTPENSK